MTECILDRLNIKDEYNDEIKSIANTLPDYDRKWFIYFLESVRARQIASLVLLLGINLDLMIFVSFFRTLDFVHTREIQEEVSPISLEILKHDQPSLSSSN
jgi:hypothetical protein